MPLLPSVFKEDHPLNAWLKLGAPIAVILLVLLVIFMQQFLLSLRSATLTTGLDSMTSVEEPAEPGVSALTVTAKLIIKTRKAHAQQAARRGMVLVEPTAEELDELDDLAINRVDKLRIAMVAGELLGPPAALTRLAALSTTAEPGGALAADIDWLRRWYTENTPRADGSFPPPTVTPEAIAALINRHGWFAQLAFSFGKNDIDPLRAQAISGGNRFLAFALGWFAFLGLISVAGVALLILWCTKASQKSLTFHLEPPSAPSQIYYETFALFCLIFIFCVMFSVAVLGETSSIAFILNQALIWACAAAVLWPRLRGVPRMEFTDDMGMTAPDGFARELLIGIGAFIASKPLLWLASFIIGTVSDLFGTPDAPVGAPMYEQPLSNSWLLVIIGGLVSIIWAPFVEEALFRGTLLTALRARFGPAAAILLSSLAFGAIHPYSISSIAFVTVMGVVLGLLRHWRGSLVAPITLHALHNGQIFIATLGTIAFID